MKTVPYIFFAGMMLLIVGCNKSAEVIREEAHWEYENPDWQHIGYAECGTKAQSPINIVTGKAVRSPDIPDVAVSYTPFSMNIVDNGHTIQVNASDEQSTTIFNGEHYRFVQLHLHHRSEHTIDGAAAPMELHVVHTDDAGNILVYARMIEEGAENLFLKTIFSSTPDVKKTEIATGLPLDLNEIIPGNSGFYTYTGSLTTPPCTHAVQFVVFKEPMAASAEQIAFFASLYSNNARPLQALNNRFILEKE